MCQYLFSTKNKSTVCTSKNGLIQTICVWFQSLYTHRYMYTGNTFHVMIKVFLVISTIIIYIHEYPLILLKLQLQITEQILFIHTHIRLFRTLNIDSHISKKCVYVCAFLPFEWELISLIFGFSFDFSFKFIFQTQIQTHMLMLCKRCDFGSGIHGIYGNIWGTPAPISCSFDL